VTMNNGSALWTDGRYFLQAEKQLDCNWILQKQGILLHLVIFVILIFNLLISGYVTYVFISNPENARSYIGAYGT
jgi:hypothetical protein